MDKLLIFYTFTCCFPLLHLFGEFFESAEKGETTIVILIDDIMMLATIVLYIISILIIIYYIV